MKGYMYILECGNGKYYVGSTRNLKARIRKHQKEGGANFTYKYSPMKLVYFEEFPTIEEAFKREQQVKGWSRKKKECLIYGTEEMLHGLSTCKNETNYKIYLNRLKILNEISREEE